MKCFAFFLNFIYDWERGARPVAPNAVPAAIPLFIVSQVQRTVVTGHTVNANQPLVVVVSLSTGLEEIALKPPSGVCIWWLLKTLNCFYFM